MSARLTPEQRRDRAMTGGDLHEAVTKMAAALGYEYVEAEIAKRRYPGGQR